MLAGQFGAYQRRGNHDLSHSIILSQPFSPRAEKSATGMTIYTSPFVNVHSLLGLGTASQAAAVVSQTSIGNTVLAAEHHYGGISFADSHEARQRLSEISNRFTERVLGRGAASGEPLSFLLMLTDFFSETHFLPPHIRRFQRPIRLTDFLLGRSATDHCGTDSGSCLPATALGAHLASLIGLKLEVLLHTDHINLYNADEGVALDLSEDQPFLAPLDLFRNAGRFGAEQKPAPLAAILSALFVNLSIHYADQQEQAKNLVEAALNVFPEIPTGLAVSAILEKDESKKEDLLKKALAINPRYLRAMELLADSLERQRRFEELGEIYRKVLKEQHLQRTH
jgi:tetratricopeptide (TPR) repeat protein